MDKTVAKVFHKCVRTLEKEGWQCVSFAFTNCPMLVRNLQELLADHLASTTIVEDPPEICAQPTEAQCCGLRGSTEAPPLVMAGDQGSAIETEMCDAWGSLSSSPSMQAVELPEAASPRLPSGDRLSAEEYHDTCILNLSGDHDTAWAMAWDDVMQNEISQEFLSLDVDQVMTFAQAPLDEATAPSNFPAQAFMVSQDELLAGL